MLANSGTFGSRGQRRKHLPSVETYNTRVFMIQVFAHQDLLCLTNAIKNIRLPVIISVGPNTNNYLLRESVLLEGVCEADDGIRWGHGILSPWAR